MKQEVKTKEWWEKIDWSKKTPEQIEFAYQKGENFLNELNLSTKELTKKLHFTTSFFITISCFNVVFSKQVDKMFNQKKLLNLLMSEFFALFFFIMFCVAVWNFLITKSFKNKTPKPKYIINRDYDVIFIKRDILIGFQDAIDQNLHKHNKIAKKFNFIIKVAIIVSFFAILKSF